MVSPLRYDEPFIVTYSMDGYGPVTLQAQPQISFWVVPNAFFGLLGLVFIAIDASNEAAYRFNETRMHANLVRLVPAGAGQSPQ